MEKKKILYVDDEVINLELLQINFSGEFEILIALTAKEGLQILKKNPGINLIITDLRMPEMDGIAFVEAIKKSYPEKICIMLTAYTETDTMIKIINEDLIFRYLLKPWRKHELSKAITAAFDKIEKDKHPVDKN